MIKTTYFDEDYNLVEDHTATIILQSFFDNDGNLIKEVEWSQTKKTTDSNSKSNEDEIRFNFLSQSPKKFCEDNIVGIQRVIDLLWRYHAVEKSVSKKCGILESILNGYSKLSLAALTFDREFKNEKDGR
jgi:hypothetical protein